jgi:hypothetical protein
MKRVVVIGLPGQRGPLPCTQFARLLALRLGGTPRLLQSSPRPRVPSPGADGDETWVAAEPAGRFTEAVFRRVDTVVWLNFSPWALLRDWLLRRQAAHAALRDVVISFTHLLMAPQMYRLLRHPALAHASLHELRTPQQALFWLKALEHRLRSARAVTAPSGVQAAPVAGTT